MLMRKVKGIVLDDVFVGGKMSSVETILELSIIVPIYNVERWLKRCLDSILTQTFNNFELILVDDGSPDKCSEIIEKYIRKDKRVVAIYQNNRGVSAARNAGLKIAQGEFIAFVDPDDWIDERMYEKLLLAIRKENADIACCSWIDVDEVGNEGRHTVDNIPYVMSGKEFAEHLFDKPRTLGGSNCNKLFRRAVIRHLYDETSHICEDNLFLAQCIVNAEKAVFVNENLYYIFSRPNSASRAKPERVVEGLPYRRRIILVVSEFGDHIRNCAEADYLDECLAFPFPFFFLHRLCT